MAPESDCSTEKDHDNNVTSTKKGNVGSYMNGFTDMEGTRIKSHSTSGKDKGTGEEGGGMQKGEKRANPEGHTGSPCHLISWSRMQSQTEEAHICLRMSAHNVDLSHRHELQWF